MNGLPLFKVTRTDAVDYDEFDSFVVAAESEEKARVVVPHNDYSIYDTWPVNISTLEVIKLTDSSIFTEEEIILSSYNAG